MIVTLQKYIFKELLRAFILTAVALTCMLGFGGGLLDMLRSSGITAREMVKLLVYLVPIVLTYSLPVSALFSATITYGRYAADNEINACRASGVNIYRLLVPVIVLSLLVCSATFILENYAIPTLAQRIERLVKHDMQSVVYMKLKSQGYAAHMDYALHCGRVDAFEQPRLLSDGNVTDGQIQLSHVAFLRHEQGMPVFYGTAKTALILFKTIDNKPAVSISLNQIRAFDEQKGQMIQAAFYPIGPFQIPANMFRKRLKFLSLPEVRLISKDPLKFAPLADAVRSLYAALKVSLTYQHLADQLDSQGLAKLSDQKGTYTITAHSYRQTPHDGRLILEGDVEIINRLKKGPYRKFFARDAVIKAANIGEGYPPSINIIMKDVKVTDSRDIDPDRFVSHDSFTLGPINGPEEVVKKAQKVHLDDLLSPDSNYDLNQNFSQRRFEVSQERTRVVNRAIAEVHSRLAFSFSSLVLLLLGAGLGIIFRGGHFVSAFGLSFIPMMVVVVMIMTGKQLSNAGFSSFGPIAIWFGVILVAIANVIILGRYLRR